MSVKASKRSTAGGSLPPRPAKRSKAPAKVSKRRESESSSAASSEDGEGENEKAAMLAALQAHSRALLGLEEPTNGESSAAGAARFDSGSSASDAGDGSEAYHEDDGWGEGDGFVSDSEEEMLDLDDEDGISRSVPEVIFAPSASGSRVEMSKAERRAFLKGSSSKILGIASDSSSTNPRKRALADDDPEDQNHRKLDKSLHDMLLSNLLPTAAVDAASRPVEKRNAMYGRLRELANLSESGKGSEDIRGAERSHHPAKIRTILMKAKEGRDRDAKKDDLESGNYVRGLGGLTDGGKKGKGRKESRMSLGTELRKKGMDGRKKGDGGRDRGLTMGVGKFKGGMLSLSERDIARVSGEGRQSGGKRKGGKGKRR